MTGFKTRLAEVDLKLKIFWEMSGCCFGISYRRFGGYYLIFKAKYYKEGFVIIHPNTQMPWKGTSVTVPAPYCDV
jgi:hypothetical protein